MPSPDDAEQLESATVRHQILAAINEALDNHRVVIDVLYSAETVDAARTALMDRFPWSFAAATAVMDMQWRRMPAAERRRIARETADLAATIAALNQRLDRDT